RHHPLDEFGLVLKTGVRMAVAQLVRGERLDFRFVLFEPGRAQIIDGLFHRSFIGRLGLRRPDQARCAKREYTRGGQITTCQLHGFPSHLRSREVWCSHPSAWRSCRPATTSIARSGVLAARNSAAMASAGASWPAWLASQAAIGSAAPSATMPSDRSTRAARSAWRTEKSSIRVSTAA